MPPRARHGRFRPGIKPLFYFFVKRVLTLPRTVLFEFQPFFDFLLVALSVIINTLTHRALKFDEIILRHRIAFLSEIFWSRQSDLNRRPTVYKTVALPLSYAGVNRLWWAGQDSNLRRREAIAFTARPV